MQKESLKNIKYLKRYKQFKTETKNRKIKKMQNPFSPGWCFQPGLKVNGVPPGEFGSNFSRGTFFI